MNVPDSGAIAGLKVLAHGFEGEGCVEAGTRERLRARALVFQVGENFAIPSGELREILHVTHREEPSLTLFANRQRQKGRRRTGGTFVATPSESASLRRDRDFDIEAFPCRNDPMRERMIEGALCMHRRSHGGSHLCQIVDVVARQQALAERDAIGVFPVSGWWKGSHRRRPSR